MRNQEQLLNQPSTHADTAKTTRYKAVLLLLYLSSLVSVIKLEKCYTWVGMMKAALSKAEKKFNVYLKQKTRAKSEQLPSDVGQRLKILKNKITKYSAKSLFEAGIYEVMDISLTAMDMQEPVEQAKDVSSMLEQIKQKNSEKLKKQKVNQKKSNKTAAVQARDINSANLDRYKVRLALLYYLKMPYLMNLNKNKQSYQIIQKSAMQLALTDFINFHTRDVGEFALGDIIGERNIRHRFSNFIGNTLGYTPEDLQAMMKQDILSHRLKSRKEEESGLQLISKVQHRLFNGNDSGEATVQQYSYFGSGINARRVYLGALAINFLAIFFLKFIIWACGMQIVNVFCEFWLTILIILIHVLFAVVSVVEIKRILIKSGKLKK